MQMSELRRQEILSILEMNSRKDLCMESLDCLLTHFVVSIELKPNTCAHEECREKKGRRFIENIESK